MITRRLEAELSKRRILELYLNVIEWGDGIWGADAAARTYFGTSAASVTREQAALLAGAIINPRTLNPSRPNARLIRRQRLILGRMGNVQPPVEVPMPAPQPDQEMPEEFLPEPPSDGVPPETTDDEVPIEEPIPSEPATVPQPEPFPIPIPEPPPAEPQVP
jgi:hypothetical protein